MSTAHKHNPPLLVFVLGAPCSGKSTLCTALSSIHDFTHFSLGAEIRQLTSTNPTGPAALIKPTFSADEIATYTENVKANTLAPMHLTPKYVKERIFGVGVQDMEAKKGVLIDGFPRDPGRWEYLTEIVKDKWIPKERGVVVVLHASREVTRERFEKRGRAGDEFRKRFDEHEEKIGEIVKTMRRDGVRVIEVDVRRGEETEGLVHRIEKMVGWKEAVVKRTSKVSDMYSSWTSIG